MNLSIILTLKNEASSIRTLLDSVEHQTRQPSEIVIVDAGSTDGTREVIERFAQQTNIPVKILISPHANIAQGRNQAIASASCQLVAVTDGGCVLDKNWLASISKPLEGDMDVVFGKSIAIGTSFVGKCFAKLYEVKTSQHKLSATEFSSRSVAFKKSAWEEVYGYPEYLSLAGEDTLFFLLLMKKHNYVVEPLAVAYWRHGYESLNGIFRMHFRNSIGSGEGNMYITRYLSLIAIYFGAFILSIAGFFWPFLYLPLLLALFLHLSRYSFKVFQCMKTMQVFVVLPILILVRELGMTLGYLSGLSNRILRLI